MIRVWICGMVIFYNRAIGCLMCELTDGNPLFPGENEMD